MKALFTGLALLSSVHAADSILLWPDGAPGSEGKTAPEVVVTSANGDQKVMSVHKPSITVYLPEADKANGAAVIIAPGGGHRELQVTYEGSNIAEWLAAHGTAAFVLKYRLAREEGSTYTIDGDATGDLRRAIRLVRSHAEEWHIRPDAVGVAGFSAGGELCTLASQKNDKGKPDATDPIERQSDRPAFQALIYPGGTKLIEPVKDEAPAFLAASVNDREDISSGLAEAYLRFKKAGVPVELHLYADSGHGFGYRKEKQTPSNGWIERFNDWLNDRKIASEVK